MSRLPYGAIWGSCQLQLKYQENASGFCSGNGFQRVLVIIKIISPSCVVSFYCPNLRIILVMREYILSWPLSFFIWAVCYFPDQLQSSSVLLQKYSSIWNGLIRSTYKFCCILVCIMMWSVTGELFFSLLIMFLLMYFALKTTKSKISVFYL